MKKIFWKKGFTLIELLVIMAIIGILSSIVISDSTESRAKALDAKRISDIREIRNALELYYADHNAYPSTASEEIIIVTNCADLCKDPEEQENCTSGYVNQESFENILKPALVDGGYIKELPLPPGYPNASVFPICYLYASPYYPEGVAEDCSGEFSLGFGLQSVRLQNYKHPFAGNLNLYCMTP